MTENNASAWAKPLDAGPIAVDDDTRDEAPTDALRERFAALLRLYECGACGLPPTLPLATGAKLSPNTYAKPGAVSTALRLSTR